MRFVLHASVLDGDGEALNRIDRILDRVADEVHVVHVPEADLLRETSWYESARQMRRKILTAAVAVPPRRHSRNRGPHTKEVAVRDPEEAHVAERLAHTPLVVLVEDREADGVLLDIFVEELGWHDLGRLWRQGRTVTPPAFEIDTAGGIGSVPARIRRAVEDAKREGRPVRLFALCDSDLRWPGYIQPTNDVQRVRDACKEHEVPCHVLRKRSAESYIPDRVYEEVRDDKRNRSNAHRFEALLRRSKVQRDHFPIKSGLSDGERKEAMAAGFYSPSEQSDLDLLKTRLLPGRGRPLLLLSRERRSAFTAEGLRARDGHGEIEELLESIAREL